MTTSGACMTLGRGGHLNGNQQRAENNESCFSHGASSSPCRRTSNQRQGRQVLMPPGWQFSNFKASFELATGGWRRASLTVLVVFFRLGCRTFFGSGAGLGGGAGYRR
jgi:hypothetical protein